MGESSHTWWERQARGISKLLAWNEINSILNYFETSVFLCPYHHSSKYVGMSNPTSAKRKFG